MAKKVFRIFEFDDYDILARILPGEMSTEVSFTIQSSRGIDISGARFFDSESEGLEFFECLDKSQVWEETKGLRMELKQKVKEKYLEDMKNHKE